MSPLVCTIMAGGAGTRFWPASTSARPKQFLRLFGERSLLQMAWDRARALCGAEDIYILTAAAFVPLVREQLPDALPNQVVGEPMRRDTAAAVALAVALCEARGDDPVLALLTADHLISPVDRFCSAFRSAAEGAEASDALYTFGIPPHHPATGFGYLELGDVVDTRGELEHRQLKRFVEKPDLEHAKQYVEEGYLWNSGMFVYRTGAIAAELDRHLPAHLENLRPFARGERELSAAFEPLQRISIDHAVMEKAQEVRCVRAPFEWSDVGGFGALANLWEADEGGNVSNLGANAPESGPPAGRLQTLDAEGNIVVADDDRELVALLGVQDLMVIRAGRRTLVCPRDRAEDIKALVASLPP